MQPSGYLTVTPTEPEDGPPYQIPWSAPGKCKTPTVEGKQMCAPIGASKRALTPAEEIFEEVKEWYRAQGKPVPISDAQACLQMIKAEKKAPEPEPERPKTLEEQLGPKPMWGDPMFWDYWRKAKALGFTKR